MTKKRFFITFEGPEGSGKTTQVNLLMKYLKTQCYQVIKTKEPGGTLVGQRLRRILLSYKTKKLLPQAELFLMLADRAQHVQEVIRPALKNGQGVICDRYSDATLAYQGYGRGLNIKWLKELNQQATGNLTPHLTFLLNLSAAEGLKRARQTKTYLGEKGKGDRFEQEQAAFHERVGRGYLALARQEPQRFKVIAVSKKSIVAVAREIKAVSYTHLTLPTTPYV